MSEHKRTSYLWPSLLDRLLDEPINEDGQLLELHTYKFENLKDSVKHDLEMLLNTRREAANDVPDEDTELRRSLLMYGLPDFSSFNPLNKSDQENLERALEEVITTFEPRLEHVHVELQPFGKYDRMLQFRVDALLHIEPMSEPVMFRTMLSLNSHTYEVQG